MSRIFLVVLLSFVALTSRAETILIENVRIFDGVSKQLMSGNVLVEDGLIARISSDTIGVEANAVVIDGANRVMTPGFIDLHSHLAMNVPSSVSAPHATTIGAVASDVARNYLDSGFTSIRDAGGTHPNLALAIERGVVYGPRVFPSGAVLSQTAGHGDWRHAAARNTTLEGGNPYIYGDTSIVVDGVDQHLAAVRENLRFGATQIKIMGGGGVMSEYDPIHSLQPSPAEIQAAVQAASDWGTYVLAHAYTSEAVQRLVENGVRCIEHGLLIDDATARMVKQNDVVISTQLVVYRALGDIPGLSEKNLEKLAVVLEGQENLIKLIKKYDITTGFSTDLVSGMYPMLTREFTERALYWTPHEVLVQATSESAKVIRMSGKLNRHGNFGEIREGWVADLLLINGEPLEDISVLRDPGKNLALIMKGGEIVKSQL
ncbi:MAG: amidohydrolase family protein [Gammaproteobacteria bacterium]|nr:amidohydrolase family protein [Gammaproteobacteria bacterium]